MSAAECAGYTARVKDMTDGRYQSSFTDEDAFRQIKDGMKSNTGYRMRPFGSRINDDDINSLVVYVRSLQK